MFPASFASASASASSSINWIDLIFVQFICTITVLGALINFIEPYLPVFVVQTFRYGKHSYTGGPGSRLVQLAEIPKAWFQHFYVFALVWSVACASLVWYVYVGGHAAPEFVVRGLDVLCGSGRVVRTSQSTTFLAVLLLTAQCLRRFYETHFVQIFSSRSRMNITHYIVGYFHYFGAFVVILGQAHGFVRGSSNKSIPTASHISSLHLSDCSLCDWIAVVVFAYAWLQQLQANRQLVRLRQRPDGTVATERHLLPGGGYFELVSSPHMLFEVLLYGALYMLLFRNTSWLFVLCWVLTNQVENAWLTHKWYQAAFKNYPAQRRAIFPWLL